MYRKPLAVTPSDWPTFPPTPTRDRIPPLDDFPLDDFPADVSNKILVPNGTLTPRP